MTNFRTQKKGLHNEIKSANMWSKKYLNHPKPIKNYRKFLAKLELEDILIINTLLALAEIQIAHEHGHKVIPDWIKYAPKRTR